MKVLLAWGLCQVAHRISLPFPTLNAIFPLMNNILKLLTFLLFMTALVFSGFTSHGDEGEAEARKYFKKSKKVVEDTYQQMSPDDHYLALHVGSFLANDAYQYGATPHNTGNGRLNAGLTYRV